MKLYEGFKTLHFRELLTHPSTGELDKPGVSQWWQWCCVWNSRVPEPLPDGPGFQLSLDSYRWRAHYRGFYQTPGDGAPITDGVFPESKEFLAGFWIVDLSNAERAYALAARISAAPGPGGAPLNMPIEVRPVPGGPPPEML